MYRSNSMISSSARTVIGHGFVAVLFLASVVLSAPVKAYSQTRRDVSVSAGSSFTDHVSARGDSRDMDLIVKFMFDEDNNQLTVSLLSYRSLFVFRESCRYSNITSCCRRLRPEKLPYVLVYNPDVKYKFSRQFKKSLLPSAGEHLFRRWIDAESLQEVPTEWRINNDFIEQVFDITGKACVVSVLLRDIFFMEGNQIVDGCDLNLRYNVTIHRNPCLGRESEIEAASSRRDALREAYRNLSSSFPDTLSLKERDFFIQARNLLEGQYPKVDTACGCPTLATVNGEYNLYVDSLAILDRTLRMEKRKGIDHSYLISKAKEIDQCVSRWLYSSDSVEKRDIIAHCTALFKEVEEEVALQGIVNAEQTNAWKLFLEAKNYFIQTCK